MLLPIRELFRGYYKFCQCGCKILIPVINKDGVFARFKQGHNHKGNKHWNWNGGRVLYDGYWVIYKPYFKYSNYRAYIQEHRYIYHIYLSIKYNRIIYLPKSYEVHHINGDKKDNRIENLMLLTRKQHKKEHRKDMSGRICNICNQKTTYKWYNDIIGFLCRECYNSILYYKYKFGII